MKLFIISSLAIIFACQPSPQPTDTSQVSIPGDGASPQSITTPESIHEVQEVEEVAPSGPLQQEVSTEEPASREKIVRPKEKPSLQTTEESIMEDKHIGNQISELEETAPHSEQVEILQEVEPGPFPVAISHATWNSLVSTHVTASGKVNYKGFLSAKGKLQTYLDLLSSNPPTSSWSKNEQLAYWINAYNAFTVKLIIDNYPLKSIMDLGKPWDKSFIQIGGKSYTLNNIEHDIIRKQFNEPRIHFAVNCASVSCPILLNEAYTADKLNAQLTKQTRAYINNPRENSLSATSIEISSLFDWYKGDFTQKGSLIQFLNTYADTQVDASATISYKNYNWSLNE